MKNSYYNITIPLSNGRILLFNTLRNKFIILNQEIETLNDKNLDIELYSVLVKNGFIIDEETNEFSLIEEIYKKSINSSVYDLTIMPTLDCNLRCWYCFEKHIVGSRLSNKISNNILNLAKNILTSDEITELKVNVFGGEPLLHFKEEVYPLLRSIQDFALEVGKKTNFNFITNGVCITDDTIPLFEKLNASFQITIDGYREKHNKIKKSRLIPKPYDVVMRAIHLLSERYDARINLRINYDNETFDHIEDVIKDIIDINRKNIRIHLERIWQTQENNEKPLNIKRIIDLFLLNKFNVSYLNMVRLGNSCKTSQKNQSVISYDGKVYKCTGRNFTTELQEGELKDGQIIWDNDKLQNRMNIVTYKNPQCTICKFLPICWGPCCQKLLENPSQIERYCQLNKMEMSVEDFIKYRINNELIQQEYEKD